MKKRITTECVETLLKAVGSSTEKALQIIKKEESDFKGKAEVKLAKALQQKEEAFEEYEQALQAIEEEKDERLKEADKEKSEADSLNKKAVQCQKVIEVFS